MSSRWTPEILAVVRKELRTELRNKSATYTAFMLSGVTVFTLAFAFYGRELTAEAASGMLWAALLFAGVGTLTRAFVAEEEQGTGDLLRMWARPHAVYWGKAIFAFGQMTATAALVVVLFLILTGVPVTNVPLLAMTFLGGAAALAGMVTLVSAMISRGSNRGTLAGVVALPLLIPLVALGVTGGRTALFVPEVAPNAHGMVQATAEKLAEAVAQNASGGWMSCAGVWLYTLLVLATAPYQFAAVWGEP